MGRVGGGWGLFAKGKMVWRDWIDKTGGERKRVRMNEKGGLNVGVVSFDMR